MNILRDLRSATKLLILKEITASSFSTLRPIADKLKITVQAVSEYMRIMQEEELIQRVGREYKATTRGVQFLHREIRKLGEFVEETTERLDMIDICGAIARTRVRKGEKVGIFMEGGILTAYSNRSSTSTGRAVSDAEPGDVVSVKGLKGIVDLSPGKLLILELPTLSDGGTRNIDVEGALGTLSELVWDKVGVLDIIGTAFAEKIGLDRDLQFTPIASVIEALQKGIDVLVLGSSDSVLDMLCEVNKVNTSRNRRICYDIISGA